LPNLPEMIQQYGIVTAPISVLPEADRQDERTDFWQVEPTYSSPFEAFVPIQNGCNKFCTYCAVPYTRGREISRSSEDILNEIKNLLDRGVRLITLLGQNVNSYGLDKKGEERSFTQLLQAIGEMSEKCDHPFWVYFTSPHPHDMTRDVIETVAQYDCLAKQIHLPVQSGDDEMLRRMNRNYTVDDYRKIISDIRELLPTATLFTDIIVGFSGETEAQFENSAKLMEEVGFNMAYVAKYSPRPGAKAAEWEDDVSPADKTARLARLSDLLKKTAKKRSDKYVGQSIQVFVERADPRMPNALSARSEGRLPVRILNADKNKIGTFQTVRIISATPLSLTGELI